MVGDHLSMRTKFLGTICPWGQKVGDQKSGDQMGLGPNELQPTLLEGKKSCTPPIMNGPRSIMPKTKAALRFVLQQQGIFLI